MRIFHLLSFRLFALITIILMVLSTAVTLLHYDTQRGNYERYVTEFGNRASQLVLGFTEHAMDSADGHMEETMDLMNTVAGIEGIYRIRIYNRRGLIVYSSDPSEIHTRVDMTDQACFMCHKQGTEIIHEPSTSERKRTFRSRDGTALLGFVTDIQNEKTCSSTNCHTYEEDGAKLGILDVIFTIEDIEEIVDEGTSDLLAGNILVTLILSFSVGFFIWIFVHRPVHRLIEGTRAISRGDLDQTVSGFGTDEIGRLGQSFNLMTLELRAAKEEITRWSNDLEQRVQEKTQELKKTQERMLQIEKMASIGKLSATVAHELNNPLSGILTYTKLIQKKLKKDRLSPAEVDGIMEHLQLMESESARCGTIIKNLLLFSKEHEAEMRLQEVNPIIERSLQLVAHHLELRNITLKRNLAESLPRIEVDENQIKQALLAILINAIEAITDEGVITVSTSYLRSERRVAVGIADTGHGIPENIREHVFEPFFTTKSAVKGVGLGLSTVYGIIEHHRGSISFTSEVHKGTVFTISIPAVP